MIPVLSYDPKDPLVGITAVAITSSPAVEVLGHHYHKELFTIDSSLHRLTAPLIRVDFNILRAPTKEYPEGYYIRFSKELAEVMAKSIFHFDPKFNIEHQNIFPDGIDLIEAFFKDSKRGINPNGFSEVADGSLFATVHITNPSLWEEIQSGNWNGFSLETFYSTLVPVKDSVDSVINFIKTIS